MERQAKAQLGIREFKSDPTCGYAKWMLPDCKNTDLDEDGFCPICDRMHFIKAFGKKYGSGNPRSDQGCDTFGDVGQDNQYGSNLLFVGTGELGAAIDDEEYKPGREWTINQTSETQNKLVRLDKPFGG